MTSTSASTKAVPVPEPSTIRGDVDTGILENIMDAYENPTYHFRLYMVSPEAYAARNFKNDPIANREKVVIAESGVSPIDIDDVEIRSFGGMSKDVGVGTATNISFTLREPYGVSLLDNIQKAGYYLGIQNFQKFPMLLELSFRGRPSVDPESSLTSSATDHPLRGMVWAWPIQLTSMAMNVTTGGSVYAMQSVAYGDNAYSNQASDIEKSISITAKTVGEFFTKLQQDLNKVEQDKEGTSNYTKFDTYQFYIDQSIYNEPIVPATKEELENRSANFNTADGTMTFTYQPGISIEKIVFNILSLTKKFQKEAKGTTDADSAGKVGGGEESIYQKLWRLIADSEPGEYDAIRGDYQKNYKYLIIPHDMATLLTPSSMNSSMTDNEKFKSHVSKGMIRKVYNYIYTGLNDQVFDFELNFNFNWFAALPIQGGLSTLVNRAEPARQVTPQQREFADFLISGGLAGGIPGGLGIGGVGIGIPNGAANDLKKFAADKQAQLGGFENPLERLQELFNSSFGNYFSEIETVTNKYDEISQQISDVQAQANDLANQALGTIQNGIPGAPEFVSGIVQGATQPFVNAAESALGNGNQAIDNLLATTRSPSRVDQTANTNVTDKAQQNIRSLDIPLDLVGEQKDAVGKIQATIQEAKSQETDGQGYAASPGQTLLSAMFEQAESPVSGDLLNIELRVKGDPYWLEPSPVKLGQAPNTIFRRLMANRNQNADQAANIDSTEITDETQLERDEVVSANTAEQQTLMVFRSFTPLEFDPETGLTPVGKKSTNVLNGVYGVREITHSFSGGEFTQTLYGMRHVNINLRNVDELDRTDYQPEDTAADAAESPPATTDTGLNTGADALDFGIAAIQQGGVDLTKDPFGAWRGVNVSPIGQITPPIYTAPNIAIPSVGSSVRIGTPSTPNTPTTSAPTRRTVSPSRRGGESSSTSSTSSSGSGAFSRTRSNDTTDTQ